MKSPASSKAAVPVPASPASSPLQISFDARELRLIDRWRRNGPATSREAAVKALVSMGLAAHRKQRLEAQKDSMAQARHEHELAKAVEDQKMERLRQVRLAKEDHARRAEAGEFPPLRQAPKRKSQGD